MMKNPLPLLSCLLLIGCGEKKAAGGNDAASADKHVCLDRTDGNSQQAKSACFPPDQGARDLHRYAAVLLWHADQGAIRNAAGDLVRGQISFGNAHSAILRRGYETGKHCEQTRIIRDLGLSTVLVHRR